MDKPLVPPFQAVRAGLRRELAAPGPYALTSLECAVGPIYPRRVASAVLGGRFSS